MSDFSCIVIISHCHTSILLNLQSVNHYLLASFTYISTWVWLQYIRNNISKMSLIINSRIKWCLVTAQTLSCICVNYVYLSTKTLRIKVVRVVNWKITLFQTYITNINFSFWVHNRLYHNLLYHFLGSNNLGNHTQDGHLYLYNVCSLYNSS